MRNLKTIGGLLVAIIIISACGRISSDTEIESFTPLALQDALDSANLRREGIVKPDYTALLPLIYGRAPRRDKPYLIRLDDYASINATVAKHDALEDTWALYNQLREGYTGYIYFGGDEVFFPVFEAIEAELLSLENNEISTDIFAYILHNHLSKVIHDRHFVIWDYAMNRDMFFYYGQSLYYEKSSSGFRNRNTGQYLKEIVGYEIEAVMKLYMDKSGEMFYRPVFLIAKYKTSMQAMFIYETEEIERSFFMEEALARSLQLPSLEFFCDIPVVTIMSMGSDRNPNSHNIEHVAPFLSFAEYLQEEPVVIVDLRGNGGGNGVMPTRWLYALTGNIVRRNHITLRSEDYNPLVNHPTRGFGNSPHRSNRVNTSRFFTKVEPFGDIHTISNAEERELIERESILILIVDRYTASAGEVMVDLVFNITNTLVVGSPTMGALAFGAPAWWALPNSNIPVFISQDMNIWPEGHFAEGVGIKPDIWVDGDALTATLALLRNAGFGVDAYS